MNNKTLWWGIGLLVAIAAVAAWYYPQISDTSDIFFYQKMAGDVGHMRTGAAPGEPSAWYPPFAAIVFYVVSLVPHVPFAALWLSFVMLAIAAATAYLYFGLKEEKAYLLPAAIIVCLLLLGVDVVLARYDILIGLLIILAWRSHRAQKFDMAILWLVLAIGLKAIPAVLLPIFLLTMPRAEKIWWKSAVWRKAGIGLLLGLAITIIVPGALLKPQHAWQAAKAFATYQSGRGFQVESVWSGVDMLAKNSLHQQALLGYHHFATHNLDLGTVYLNISTALVVLGLLAGYVVLWRKRAAVGEIAPHIVAAITWVLLTASVFSPQFLLWAIPLALMWFAEKVSSWKKWPKDLIAPLAFIAVILLFSQWIYPWHYVEFLQQQYVFNTMMLNFRNLAVALLCFWCLRFLGVRLPHAFKAPFISAWNFLKKPSAPLTVQQKKVAGIVIIAIAAAFIAYICAFKLLDRDFWWHIKAGEIMVNTHKLISVEPFAYTRAGQAYVATHEWLAQIILYFIYHAFGANGIIVFRTLTMAAIFGLFLWIDRKRAWLNSLLVILAANAVQPGFIERPQLFTFIIFAVMLYMAIDVLRRGLTQRHIIWFVVLEILWVNLHGAASLLGLLIVGSLALQYLYDWWRLPANSRPQLQEASKPWLYALGGMVLGMLISPATYHNFTYIYQLLNDHTIIFINEWQPRNFAVYLGDYWIIWIVAAWALLSTRRNWVFSGLLVLITGYLSRKALRHEMLFAFAAVAITIYQLEKNKWYAKFTDFLASRQVAAVALLMISWGALALYSKAHFLNFAQEDQLFGYGVFAPAKGAEAYIEKNNLQGHMFNTYGIGGYLLNKGYPNRQVYIDGRNVDYGFDFMNATYQGAIDDAGWEKLDKKFNFNYAVIDYTAIAKVGRAGYSVHLDKNPNWPLVYLDDWTAIYVKKTPENKDIIARDQYKILNPINIDKGQVLDTLTDANKADIKKELQRVIDSNPDGVDGRILLARVYISDNQFDKARELLGQVQKIQPHLPDTYQLLASIALAQQQWIEAAAQYDKMLANLGSAYPDVNYAAIAEVYSKAGKWLKGGFYNWLARPAVANAPAENPLATPTPTPSAAPAGTDATTQNTIADLLSGIGDDINKYNEQGIDLAQKGQVDPAKDAFLNALKLDPGNPKTLNNLGVLSLQTGKIDEAVDYLKRAFDRSKNDYADAHFNLAIAYYKQGKIQDALAEAKTAQKQGRKEADQLITFLEGKLK
jgi:tetratricopeptide (TPR) repeat protein